MARMLPQRLRLETKSDYVGMSRARTRLVILAPETLPDALRRALEG
jgi:ATP-dependent exoDNAse (exonuclease V) alpha subunit